MAKKITNLLAKITSGLSHAFLSSQLEFSASQHMYGILIWSTKTMIPLEMHICQVPKISFLAYLEWSTNKIMAGKAFWGCSAPICQFFEFRQVHLNSYSEQFLRGFCTSGAQLMMCLDLIASAVGIDLSTAPHFFVSSTFPPILWLQPDFFTILLVFLVRGCPDEPKLSSREVEYTLTPRYKPLGDYYVITYAEGQVVKPYIFVEICIWRYPLAWY